MPSPAEQKFRSSMFIDYEKWHDGIGYDLDAFRQMTPDEQRAVAMELIRKSDKDWRDLEVIALVDIPEAKQSLQKSAESGPVDQRVAALARLVDAEPVKDLDGRIAELLGQVDHFKGLEATLRMAAEHGGPQVKLALLKAVRDRPSVAVNYAGLVYYLAGLTKEQFDWDHRPFFLRFHADEPHAERMKAFAELCEKIGVDPNSIPKSP